MMNLLNWNVTWAVITMTDHALMKQPSEQHKPPNEKLPPLRIPKFVPPQEIAWIFDEPPLLGSEQDEIWSYHHLRVALAEAIEPVDAIEWLWVKDLTDLAWETRRLRRMRNELVASARHRALLDLLHELNEPTRSFTDDRRHDMVQGWSSGDPERVAAVNTLLAQHGLSEDTVTARAMASKLKAITQAEAMITGADARRIGILREIERRRSAITARVRAVTDAAIASDLVPAEAGDVLKGEDGAAQP